MPAQQKRKHPKINMFVIFYMFILNFIVSISNTSAMEHQHLNGDDRSFNQLKNTLIVWHQDSVFKSPDPTCLQKGAQITGSISGVVGLSVFGVLGYNFAQRITEKAPRWVQIGTGATAGVISMIPVGLIGSGFTGHIFNQAVTFKTNEEKFLFSNTREFTWKNAEFHSIRTIEALAGIYSAIPLVYVTADTLYELISYGSLVSIIPAFYVKAILDAVSIDIIRLALVENIYYPIKRYFPSLSDQRFKDLMEIEQKLTETESLVMGLTDDQTDILIQNIFGESDENPTASIRALYDPQSVFDETLQPATMPGFSRKAFGAVGGFVGAYAMAHVKPLADLAISPVLDYLGINTPLTLNALSWTATATAASLVAFATSDSFMKIHDGFAYVASKIAPNQQNTGSFCNKSAAIRSVIATSSLVIATIASAPQVEMSIQYLGDTTVYEKIALASSLIGPLAMNFWPVDTKLASYASSGDKRLQILGTIGKIRNSLPEMRDDTIDCFKKILFEQKNISVNSII